jgi:hypothetical protein
MAGKEPVPAPDVRFVLSVTPEELPDDTQRPCAYCNPDELIAERMESIKLANPDISDEEARAKAPVMADYILRFGHKDGAGVEVPVCDMSMDGVPVEYDETAREALDFQYMGDGKFGHYAVTEELESGQKLVEQRIHPDCW